MQAIFSTTYGPPEQLQVKEVPTPTPKANEVLVRVKAASINDHDWSMVRGKPHVYRLFFGLFRPRQPIPGMEFSGIVLGVGTGVTRFRAGDAVYGDTSQHGGGCFAEYRCVDEQALLHKPAQISFIQAAATPHALCLATKLCSWVDCDRA